MNRRQFLIATAAATLAACRDPLFSHDLTPGPTDTAPPAADLVGPTVLGITSHILRDDDLRLVRDLGFTHIRGTLISTRWARQTGYAAAMREHVARVTAHGLQLLFVVHNSDGAVFRSMNDPAAAAAFTAVVESMVRTLPEVEAWQLWNEMDVWLQAPFGSGENPPMPALFTGMNYGRWWRTAYPRLKAVRPESRFVTGATADHSAGRWRDFLRGMVNGGFEADAIAFHVYGDWSRTVSRHAEIRKIVGADQRFWLTEFNARPGIGWTPTYQAESVRGMIEGNARDRLFERIYAYCLETDPKDPWYGLRNPDGSERPLLEWLRSKAAGG